MPTAPRRSCGYPGCNVLSTTPRCDKHTHLNTGTFNDPNRASASERGYDSKWRKVRAFVLKRDNYLCQVAKRDGRIEVADEVDHVISKALWLQRHGTLDGVDDPSNLQAIGRERHKLKTQAEALAGRLV